MQQEQGGEEVKSWAEGYQDLKEKYNKHVRKMSKRIKIDWAQVKSAVKALQKYYNSKQDDNNLLADDDVLIYINAHMNSVPVFPNPRP